MQIFSSLLLRLLQQELSKEAQKQAQPVIDDAKAKAADIQSKAGEIQSQAKSQAQPVFDSAKEQYQKAERSAIKAKDDAMKQAQPVLDDAKQKSADVTFAPLHSLAAVYCTLYMQESKFICCLGASSVLETAAVSTAALKTSADPLIGSCWHALPQINRYRMPTAALTTSMNCCRHTARPESRHSL